MLTFGENISFNFVKTNQIGTGNMYNNKLRGAYGTSPLQPLYLQQDGRADLNDGYSYSIATDWNQYDGNPVAGLYRGRNKSDRQNWLANVFAELTPIKGLHIKTQLGFNHNTSTYRAYTPDFVSTTNNMHTSGPEASQNINKSLDTHMDKHGYLRLEDRRPCLQCHDWYGSRALRG